MPAQWHSYIFHLLFDRQFKVLSMTGMSSTWRPLRIGVPQGLHSVPLVFNLYINATLEELNSRSNGSYPYADDNTLRYHARHKESKPEFVSRMSRVLVSVEKGYEKIKGVLSKQKRALLPMFHRIDEVNIGSIPALNYHKILGVWIDNKRSFHHNSVEVLIKCRRALTWIQTYRRKFSFQQRRQVYVSFIQSLMDYHLLPTRPRMTKYHKLQWTRVAYRAARMILGVSLTVSGSIACREAGLLPPAQRFRYLWFKRALRCRRFESEIQQSIYEKSLENLV